MAPKPGRETTKKRTKSRKPFHLNVRIARHDGAKVSATEAGRVMHYFQRHLDAPSGYALRAIDWGTGKELDWTDETREQLRAVITASKGSARVVKMRAGLTAEG